DDGYLSASEIAALKLDADWIILSACNTAAGNTEGAEALSGLARAFFYAGARAPGLNASLRHGNGRTVCTAATAASCASWSSAPPWRHLSVGRVRAAIRSVAK